ncbi:ankyrin repeat-containing domain protein [Microdochium trichocladiopsis]|uniref:Ankyrin repeat-containing domain protein n=1 Tax=Microdochium trichocladiopsis TaxID=1682393 RepID=A0A9P8Y430_9PEZI|nr:ankyrin repeat-containing domain protein [Microdochium trichocladiopsis]KAH7028985.1 ankyrin repeat-containing domain protein [Microdochium trichocladiopsis]
MTSMSPRLSMAAPSPGLAILPTELILKIVSHLSTRDAVCGLAYTSRHYCTTIIDFAYARHIRSGAAGGAPLWYASRKGLVQVAERALRCGANVNEFVEEYWRRGINGSTPLAWAVTRQDAPMVKLLLEYGASPVSHVPWYDNCVTRAAADGNQEIARLLLEQAHDDFLRTPGRVSGTGQSRDQSGKTPRNPSKLIHVREGCGKTALHRAAAEDQSDMIHFLLDYGADLEARDGEGLTPLCAAVEAGRSGAVRTLLALGADVLAMARDNKQNSLTTSANNVRADVFSTTEFLERDLAIFRQLLEAITLKGQVRHTAAEVVQHPGTRSTPRLLDIADYQLNEVLYLCSSAAIKILIDEYNVDPDVLSPDGLTPLMRRIMEPWSPPPSNSGGRGWVPENDAIAIGILLEAGAQVDSLHPRTGETPLLTAIEAGLDPEVCLTLLRYGASVTARGRDGMDALLKAMHEQDVELAIHLLRERKAAAQTVDVFGISALAHAVSGFSLEVARDLIQRGAELETRDNLGRTPLMQAVVVGFTEGVSFLLGQGAEVDALAAAEEEARGTDANEVGPPLELKETPLMVVMRHGVVEIVKILIEHGADVKLAARLDPLLLQHAWGMGDHAEEIVRLLGEHGVEGMRPLELPPRRSVTRSKLLRRRGRRIVVTET